MNTNQDERYYRGLLETTQKAIEEGRVFLRAVGSSEVGRKNAEIQKMAESTTKHIEQLERQVDQLWDLFKRVLKGD